MALRLKQRMAERGISLQDAARGTGLSRGLLSGILNQGVSMTARSREKLSAWVSSLDGEGWGGWDQVDGRSETMLRQEVLLHFGLVRDPFVDEIRDPAEDYYVTGETRWVEERIEQIVDGNGFGALVGPTGAGKSLLLERIIARKRNIAIAKPRMCDTESLHAGAIYDSIIYDFTEGSPKQSREARARQMVRALVAKRQAMERALLVVEEAHRLHVTTLRALKSFYDERLEGRRLLSILLIGQEGLRDKVGRADMLEVSRRCQVVSLNGLQRIVKGKLHPPTSAMMGGYLATKLRRCGPGQSDVPIGRLFDEEALGALSVRADVPLHANVLAMAALTRAWETGSRIVTREVVNEC